MPTTAKRKPATARKRKPMIAQHGGPRPNSGRKTRYPRKVRETLSLWLTDKGKAILDAAMARNKASMADVIEHLLRTHGRSVTLPPLPEGNQ